MSAGSAFASGVRAGQNIWNSAVNNAMAGKRMDMLKTQFQFEQTQRMQALDDQLVATSEFDFAQDSFARGEFDLRTPKGRKKYGDFLTKIEPAISRDPVIWKRYESFKKTFEDKESFPFFREQARKLLLTGVTWDQNNLGMPRPQIKDEKTGELVDDTNLMKNLNRETETEVEEKTKIRAANFKVIQEWNEKFPGERFPVVDLPRLPGEPAPDVPVKDFAAATMLMSQEAARLTEEEAFDVAETKDKIAYRGDFNRWKKLIKNPALDAKKPDDQKLFRTYQHDEQISVLMAEAGLEAFKLSDKLIPDPVSGGYENMAQVTGMINDMIRAQEEAAGLRKEEVKRPLTESQAKDYIFSGRLKLTEETMAKLEARGFRPESIPQAIFMTGLPEFGKTNDQKLYIAARANWIGAQLRRLSGAAIKPEEYEQDIKEYFPLVNDSPEVIAYKRDLRRQVERDMRAIAINQPVMFDYKTTGKQVIYNNIADVEAAVSRGRLKVGDTYKYKTQLGGIQNGVVQPPAP